MPVRTTSPTSRSCIAVFVGVALSLSGCGGGGSDVGPDETGGVTASVSTSGTNPDPDGYTLTIDGASSGTLNGSGPVTVNGLAPGNHAVGLDGVADNCTVQGENPQLVTITSGGTASVAFTVVCAAPPPGTGAVLVTTTTTGSDVDADGYIALLDGAQPGVAVPASGSATFSDVTAGSHTITLSGVAANCTVSGGASTSTSVSAGATSNVSFSISCASLPPSVGVLRVSTTTTGQDQDPDGYRFAVDNGTPQAIGVNAATDLANTAAGTHTVVLSNVAANCSVDNASKQATVTAGATTTVAFSIICAAIPPSVGSIKVTTSTSGPDQDGDGYRFSVDGGQAEGIGVNESQTVGNLAPGAHTVQLSGVAPNCAVDDASKQATVTAGATATVAFTITCTEIPPAVGSIRVSTTTSGANPDPDGYQFAVDGGSNHAIGVSANQTLTGVTPGSHTVVLSDIAGNCSVSGGPSKTVSVTAGQTAEAAFQITCPSAGPSASRSSMLADPKVIATGASSTITVTVRDADGAVLAGVPVTLSASGTGNTITPVSPTTNAEGKATFTFSSIVADDKTITAKAGGVTLSDTEVITVFVRPSTTTITSINPEPSIPGQTIRVTVTVTGQGGGTPTGTVNVSSDQETGGCTAAPLNNGTATCDFALNTVGQQTIRAAYSGDGQFDESTAAAQHQVNASTTAPRSVSKTAP
jgi:Bacterial Ig-like domain (group 3)/Bacterial Ig-like domain (group 1)